MRKKGIKHYLTIIALCCSICYLLLRIFGLVDRYGHLNSWYRAYALEDVRLTLEQTVALYGSSFSGTYYNDTDNVTYSFHASLTAFTSQDFIPTDYEGSQYVYFSGKNNHVPTDEMNALESQAYLIYKVNFDRLNSAGSDAFTSSNTTDHANIGINFPFTFGSISRFRCNYLWSARTNPATNAPNNNSYHSRSYALFNTSFNSVYSILAGPMNQANTNQYGQVNFPLYRRHLMSDPLDESLVNYMHYIVADIQNPDPTENFALSGVNLTLNACGVINYSLGQIIDDYSFYLLVGTPIISGEPEVTTTRPAQTTRAPYTGEYQVTTGQYTYDLSPLETNQINQINIANENLNYVAGIFDGINIIIQQLDDIYKRMAANGEIAVNLVPGDSVKWYETDVKQQIDYIIDGHTTATLPDISTQMSFISSAYSFMMRQNWIAVLGGLSLAVSAACWILFEGRK